VKKKISFPVIHYGKLAKYFLPVIEAFREQKVALLGEQHLDFSGLVTERCD